MIKTVDLLWTIQEEHHSEVSSLFYVYFAVNRRQLTRMLMHLKMQALSKTNEGFTSPSPKHTSHSNEEQHV